MKYRLGSYITEIIEADLIQGLELITRNSVMIIDQNVAGLYPVINSFSAPRLLIEAKETNKYLKTAEKIFSWLQENKAQRNTAIVAVGGGITTDIAGWAAGNYMRGCHLINIPTTLIGMIDAAIGGKTAVNFQQTKNLIGSYYPAEKVILIPELLKTLPENEIMAGFAELVKMALLPESKILKLLIELKSDWHSEIRTLLRMAIEQKMKVCEIDLQDRSERRLLNLGHTFAHVIESVSEYQIEHGRAVAIGIIKAAALSYEKKLITKNRYDFIISLMHSHFPEKYLQLEEWIINAVSKNGREFYENDKKSKLILFTGQDAVSVCEAIKWNEFKNILTEKR